MQCVETGNLLEKSPFGRLVECSAKFNSVERLRFRTISRSNDIFLQAEFNENSARVIAKKKKTGN